jgi:hypothetical protein
MIKNQIEKMKNNAIKDSRDLYETVSIKIPAKSYAMLELLSRLSAEPKTSLLTKDISDTLYRIVATESEETDLIEEIINKIDPQYYQESFIEQLINNNIIHSTPEK